jgi:type III pantothenate kinase
MHAYFRPLAMNLAIDYGNTFIKGAFFDGTDLKEKFQFSDIQELKDLLKSKIIQHCIVSSVSKSSDDLFSQINVLGKKLSLHVALPLPIRIIYSTPDTLGVDRIAGVCGAQEIFPSKNCLVIDAGTCINYEFLDAQGTYHGGGISPGVRMRFEAMHTFTARLPLVSAVRDTFLIGASTETCMQSGVMNGVIAEMDGIIEKYRKLYPTLTPILCGGDAHFFENKLKDSIFVAPDLVLCGLNRILLHNVSF